MIDGAAAHLLESAGRWRLGSVAWRSRLLACVAVLAAASGCASRPSNERITAVDATRGYRVETRLAQRAGNDPHTILVLAFSGGGTRAAAFSYGLLEALRSSQVVVDGRPRRLLDEVDVITGVSGGSFTALAYALYGEQLFGDYETRFLKRDVQGALIWRTLNPFNWPKLMGSTYGRSELAADYYDEILFEGATFGDLLDKATPVAVVASTDLSTGARVEFTQYNFDVLCSDLSAVRLARAAAGSSAVPLLLSPVTFTNYGGTCGYSTLPTIARVTRDITNSRNGGQPVGRAMMRMREQSDLERSAERPFIHLVDGGVSDNLALRGVLETLETMEVSPEFRRIPGFDRLHRIAVIVVNAHVAPAAEWDRRDAPPGVVAQLVQSSSVPIDRYSYESVQLMRDVVERWEMQRELAIARHRLGGASELEANDRAHKIRLFVIDLSFEAIADPEEKRYFMNLPTSFALPSDAIDRLRRMAGQLLDESPDYRAFLDDLRQP